MHHFYTAQYLKFISGLQILAGVGKLGSACKAAHPLEISEMAIHDMLDLAGQFELVFSKLITELILGSFDGQSLVTSRVHQHCKLMSLAFCLTMVFGIPVAVRLKVLLEKLI